MMVVVVERCDMFQSSVSWTWEMKGQENSVLEHLAHEVDSTGQALYSKRIVRSNTMGRQNGSES